ncbi:MAG: DUF3501 family protein [Myxococcota bacterium]
MKKIQRNEILDLGAYEGVRNQFRTRIIALKKRRRVSVGDHLTFVFENRDTMLWQIQEMVRTERITKESAIQHEVDTYNDLVPSPGHLSATLMIEYDDREERARMLGAFHDLGDHVSLVVGDRAFKAVFQPLDGEEEDRLPAVNYLRFEVGHDPIAALRDREVAVSLRVTHPEYRAEQELAIAAREELAEDLE